jgi:hypothetical protein
VVIESALFWDCLLEETARGLSFGLVIATFGAL